MNEPRKPDAQWVAEVRARNRERLGLGQAAERPVAGWKILVGALVLGYVYWKLTS